MATLNLPRLTVGLLVWLFSTLVVSNVPGSYQESTLCQENKTNDDLLHYSPIKYPFPPFSSHETITTSN